MIALEQQLIDRLAAQGAAPWRIKLAHWIESPRVVAFIIGVILVNALILGLETDRSLMARSGTLLVVIDKACLLVFIVEITLKLLAFRGLFWRSGWNIFDFVVVAVALVPGAGPWAVIRSLRVLRVLRLLTMVPSLRKVVAAFLHAIPGLGGVLAVMAIFFYTASVLATNLFGAAFPAWFGTIGRSLFSLFQIMTLESWSMGIVRPVMEQFPYAWAFFVPFIILATFTILNLFIGIIVSTMQELSTLPEPGMPKKTSRKPWPVSRATSKSSAGRSKTTRAKRCNWSKAQRRQSVQAPQTTSHSAALRPRLTIPSRSHLWRRFFPCALILLHS